MSISVLNWFCGIVADIPAEHFHYFHLAHATNNARSARLGFRYWNAAR